MDLALFKEVIKEKCGLTFEDVRADTLEEGVRTRMGECRIHAWKDYLNRLVGSETEFTNLINLLTINETYFFREPAHFELLTNRLLPGMLASKGPGETVRILSAGCSTGEEPYSLMIALIEKYGVAIRNSVSIVGADIDSNVLARAEQGLYSSFSFRNLPNGLQERYFDHAGSARYRIKQVVRKGVRFQSLNLMSENYPPALQGLDAIFYRNVSIYFDLPTQKRIFAKLAGLLNESGYLFVSSTETLSHDHGVLSLIEADGLFCYRRGFDLSLGNRRSSAGQLQQAEVQPAKPKTGFAFPRPVPASGRFVEPFKRTEPEAPSRPAVFDTSRTASPPFDQALDQARRKNYEDALKRIDEIEQADSAYGKGRMLKAGILINIKRFEEAEDVCLKSMDANRWCLECYLLLGLIAKMRDDEEVAVKRFKEAMYIDSSCWLAHFYTAEIYSRRNDPKNARREYEIVIRLLQKGTLSDHGLTFFPLAFPAEQIMHLCRHNLAKLEKGKE